MKKLTALRAIRLKCIDCCAGSQPEVRRCEITDCSLHGFRFGHKPTSMRGSSEKPPKYGGVQSNKSILEANLNDARTAQEVEG